MVKVTSSEMYVHDSVNVILIATRNDQKCASRTLKKNGRRPEMTDYILVPGSVVLGGGEQGGSLVNCCRLALLPTT